VRGERPVIGDGDGVIQPLLRCSVSPVLNGGKSGRRKKRTEGSPPLIVLFLRGDWFRVSGLYWDWAGIGGEVE